MTATAQTTGSATAPLDARIGVDSRTFGGPLDARLAAVREAGFAQIMLWHDDLERYPGGAEAACACVAASGLAVTGLQLIRDVEGGRDDARWHEAERLCALAARVGAPLLLACSQVDAGAVAGFDASVRDLRRLADLAGRHGIRVAYEALSWGAQVAEPHAAARLVAAVAHPALGLAIDTFHLVARGIAMSALDDIDVAQLSLVQISDLDAATPVSNAERIELARHRRLFPGEGRHGAQVEALLASLAARGYAGPVSLEVFNDAFRACDARELALRARRVAEPLAAKWAGRLAA